MNPNPLIMKSVEQLNYRMTVGDVAAQAGLEINQAQQGLLALASEAGGHLQVADTGDIVFLFPKNFRAILRNKYWRLQLQEWWEKVWKVLFYLIRISFGIILVLSIILMIITIIVIIVALNSRDSNSGGGGSSSSSSSSSRRSGGMNFFIHPFFWSDLFSIFDPGYNKRRQKKRQESVDRSEMNFLEAIYSFLFGDGDPNANLEERRWQEIGTVITNNGGAVIAQQIAPYLDNISPQQVSSDDDDEDYMLPVLIRFNGYPEVSPEGGLIYYFPELQVSARKRKQQPVSPYLQENWWRFSQASSGQVLGAIGLGSLNFILALVLGSLLQDEVVAELGGLVLFVDSIYWLLLGYGTVFLTIPLLRYFWIQWKNKKIESRNVYRQNVANILHEKANELSQKINYARNFAAEKVITKDDITYSTETDLIDQELDNSDRIDQEWRRRLEQN
jgi:hypothetical protein